MSLLDVSIVNVALPSIREGLHASTSDLQWVVSGYALAFGLVLVPAGRLGDVRGRRTMFLTGLILFVVASAVCGFATGPLMLIVARLAQGVGGGILNPQVSGFVQELFRGKERGGPLRPARRDHRPVDGRRPARRRPAHPAVRGVVGLAGGLLRQRADRHRRRGARADVAAGPLR